MRRLDKMTKEEIMQFCTCDCEDCPLHNAEVNNVCSDLGEMTCDELKRKWLEKEIEMKSRWELCKTDEDFIKLVNEAGNFCEVEMDCGDCRLKEECKNFVGGGNCHIKAYGTEKVEVEE